MQDNEIRRLDLKARLLSSEIIRLEEKTRKTGQQLRNQQKIRLDAERCWNKLLAKALNDNKNAPWAIKKELIVGNLQNLSQAKNVLSSHKLQELLLSSKLVDLASNAKKVMRQIEHVKSKLKSSTQIIESRHENVLAEELVSMKSIQHRDSGYPLQLGLQDLDQSDNIELRLNDSNTPSADSARHLDSEVLPAAPSTPWKIESEYKSVAIPPASSPAASHCRAFESDGQSIPQSELVSSQRWTKAESSQKAISEQNQNVKVLVHHSAAGEGVIIDYQHAAGRMLTVAAHQPTSSKAVALNLQASNQKDREQILKNSFIIQENLENSGLLISKFEVEK